METLRKALEEIARHDPAWFEAHVPSGGVDRYGEWTQGERVVHEAGPQGGGQAKRLQLETGRDGFTLLDQLEERPDLLEREAVRLLKTAGSPQFRRTKGSLEVESPPDGERPNDPGAPPEPGPSAVKLPESETSEREPGGLDLATDLERKVDGPNTLVGSPHEGEAR